MNAKLPANATATDVIDLVTEATFAVIKSANPGMDSMSVAFADAFDRTFPVALDRFFSDLEAKRPELAQRIRTEFIAEEEARRTR